MRSRVLHATLAELAEQAAARLHAEVLAGSEVPFELASHASRRRNASLYCYRPLTAAFLAERAMSLRTLSAYAEAAARLEDFDGLDRYLLARDADSWRTAGRGRVDAALLAFLQDVFEEQTDFELRSERLKRALERVDGSALASPAKVTFLATLHGLMISSEELALTHGLAIAKPRALEGAPEPAADEGNGAAGGEGHLLVVFTAQDPDAHRAIAQGREVVRELLRALRLFGDGRLALGAIAWSRVADGPWSAQALGTGGQPHGMLLVTAEQEDELRAFCNLISRRTPDEGKIAWAMRRFEMGCEHGDDYEALSDHLLALRALLAGSREAEREGSSSGLLAARLAALCATPEHRVALTERILSAIELERAVIAGVAVEHAGGVALARELSDHLRALLRDVICGHLPTDLVSLADELLLSGREELGEEPLVFAEAS